MDNAPRGSIIDKTNCAAFQNKMFQNNYTYCFFISCEFTVIIASGSPHPGLLAVAYALR